MSDLPRGTVTFLFTDVEGSTRLWEEAPESMMEALRIHDEVVDDVTARHNGVGVKPRGEGDSRFVVFASAVDAVAAAAAMQQGLTRVDWPTPRPIRVRASLHTGIAEMHLDDYYGSAVNRAARLRAIAHGGQTVMSESTWQLVCDALPAGVAVTDMGEHRLKDLTRPEHVYQIDAEGLPTEFPPLASLDAAPTNLPVQVTEFVGREAEMADVRAAIARSRLVTILAPGGTGKTRLAIQAGAEMVSDFPGGVFFADLAPLDHAGDAPKVLADAMGMTLGGDEDQATQLLAYISRRRMLLIVDNTEHIPDVADLVAAIIHQTDSVNVVATSRTKLNVAGESVLRLSGFDHEWASVAETFDSPAVRLFVDAARRADTRFELGEGDLAPLARLIELVGGLPLGILLAASWVDSLAVDEIVDEVSRSMDFLVSEARDVPSRHQSMRAVFEYSWSLLTEPEQSALAALSVFRGGFTREAAGAVAAAEVRVLSRLESKSLITFDRDARRYAVHELVREYSGEELARHPERQRATLLAHSAYYAELVDQGVARFLTADDQSAVLRALEADYQNLRAVLRRALADKNGPVVRSVLIGLDFLLELRGSFTTKFEMLSEAAKALHDDGDPERRIVAALADTLLARAAVGLGLEEDHVTTAEEAVDVLRHSDDTGAFLFALEALAEIMTYTGRADRVLEVAREAMECAVDAGDPLLAAAMSNYAGIGLLLSGRPDEALAAWLEGDAALRAAGDGYMRSWNLEGQATVALLTEDLAKAVEIRREQLTLARSIGYDRVEAIAARGLASGLILSGELEESEQLLHRALELAERTSALTEQALALMEFAALAATRGHPAEAVTILTAIEGHKSSQRMHPLEGGRLGEIVARSLTEYAKDMDQASYASARDLGALKGFDVIVKELVAR